MRTLLALIALLPVAAQAQSYNCTLPDRITAPVAPQQDGETRRVAISGYTLAVSWSPEFCRGARDKGEMQCSKANGRFGFILHGLWPEGKGPKYPQWCSLTPRPAPALLRANLCMTPSARLLEHEWAKHGSCMAKTPAAYFRSASALWQSLRWPDADALSRQQDLTVGDLRAEFLKLNPDWRAEQVAVNLSRSGWLKELRLCYDRKFMPVDCPRGQKGAGDAAGLKVWRGL